MLCRFVLQLVVGQLMYTQSMTTSATRGAITDNDAEEEERQRREYLARHHARLEQKRRLETEKRVDEQALDTQAIQERRDKYKSVKANEQEVRTKRAQLPASRSLSALPPSDSPVGTYSRLDELSTEMLRAIAEKQSLRELSPLNTRGKYHARFMKNAYPIAGTQLKLEKERELILGAKKKILLSIEPLADSTQAATKRHGPQMRDTGYSKLDYYGDTFTKVLKDEEKLVGVADRERSIRLANVHHYEGLRKLWELLRGGRIHESVAWLKSHSFRDVNIPVLVCCGNDGQLAVSVNKESGFTPLMVACRLVSVELVKALLEQDAVTYLATANGDQAIHFVWKDWPSQALHPMLMTAESALRAHHAFAILQELLKHKADVNAQNMFGETALQSCARFGLEDCMKLLLNHGADVGLADRKNKTAADYARQNHHERIACTLDNFKLIEQTRRTESERRHQEALLRQGRGALISTWSQSPDKLFARLAVEERRVGHLRHQYVDRHGQVIECQDED